MLEPSEPTTLPEGRLLYRPLDAARYVVVVAAGIAGHWIVEAGWTKCSRCAGPFSASDALRALRLSNTLVPEGCELGPWQTGLALFPNGELPAHPNQWSCCPAAWLPPTMTLYRATSHEGFLNEKCCAPPTQFPKLRPLGVSDVEASELEHRVSSPEYGTELGLLGLLAREWNVHPAGSPVYGATANLAHEFLVIDLPPGA
jgi:hypothetical protein